MAIARKERLTSKYSYITIYAIIPSCIMGVKFNRKRKLYCSSWDSVTWMCISRAHFITSIPKTLRFMESWMKRHEEITEKSGEYIINTPKSFFKQLQ